MIESFDAIYYTSIFIIPGFVMTKIINACNPSTKMDFGEAFIQWLLLSLFNFCCCRGMTMWLYSHRELFNDWYWVVFLLSVLFIATLVAILIAKIKQGQVIRKILSWFHVYIKHSIPTSWDNVFSKPDTQFITVTLTNGEQISGIFSTESFASESPNDKDIFIEQMYNINGNKWELIEGNKGILIIGENIRTIEFYNEE